MFRLMVIGFVSSNRIPCNIVRNRKFIPAFIKISPEDFSFQIFYLMMEKYFKRYGNSYSPCVLPCFLFHWLCSGCCKSPDFRNDFWAGPFAACTVNPYTKETGPDCIKLHVIIKSVILRRDKKLNTRIFANHLV